MRTVMWFLTGWISSEAMEGLNWKHLWKGSAIDAENRGCTLVCFRIPTESKERFERSIERIEHYLETEYMDYLKKWEKEKAGEHPGFKSKSQG